MLVPSLVGGGDDHGAHPRACLDGRPGVRLALLVYLVLGLTADIDADRRRHARRHATCSTPSTSSRRSTSCRSLLLVVLAFRKVPAVPRRSSASRPVHRGAGLHHPARRRRAPSSTSRARARCSTRHRGDLHGHGQRFVVDERQRDDRRPVHRRRHGQHAHHGLADPRRAQLRRHHGGAPGSSTGSSRHLVRRAQTARRLILSVVGTCLGLNIVAGDQYVADVLPSRVLPRRVRAARARAPDAVAHGGGHRDRHVAARAVEQLRRLHDRACSASPPCSTCRAPSSTSSTRWSPSIYALTGFRVERLPPSEADADATDRPAGRPSTVIDQEEQPCHDQAAGQRPRPTQPPPADEPKRRFTLPSAYTILFALIVVMAHRHLDHPGRHATRSTPRVRRSRAPTRRWSRPRSGSSSTRSRRRSTVSTASRIPATGNVDFYNSGELFGAIDVALFILVIGGFIGITMKTGAIQAGIALLVEKLPGPRAVADPDPDDGLRHRRDDLRHGGGEPRLLRPDHHRDDRGGLRRRWSARAVILLGCGIGVLGSTINPFATGIASDFAGHPARATASSGGWSS